MEFRPSALILGWPLRGHRRGRGFNRAERWGGLARTVCLDRFDEEGEDPLALQPTRLNDGQDPLRESGAAIAAGAEAPLPPEDAPPQDALRMVVRRLDAFATEERPERRLQVQEVLTEGRRLCVGQLQPLFQEDLEILPDPSHRKLKSGPIDRARLEVMPDREEVPGQFRGLLTDPDRLTSPVDQLLEITDQMSPAYLAAPQGSDAVDLPAVTGEDPTVDSSQESAESSEPAVGVDHEVRHRGGGRGPHPDRLVPILPACLVEILGVGFPYRFGRLLMRSLECLGGLGLHVRDGAQGNAAGNAEDVLEELLGLASAALTGPAEERGQSGQPGSERIAEHFLRDRAVVDATTAIANHREISVLRHLAGLRRKVRDLMAMRRLSIGPRLGEQGMAVLALLRGVGDEVIHLVGWKKTAILPLVSELAPGIAPAGRLGVGPRSLPGVGRRWFVGVPGIQTEPLLESFDPIMRRLEELLERQKGGDKCFQLRHSRGELGAVRAGVVRPFALHFLHADVIGRRRRITLREIPKIYDLRDLPVNGYRVATRSDFRGSKTDRSSSSASVRPRSKFDLLSIRSSGEGSSGSLPAMGIFLS